MAARSSAVQRQTKIFLAGISGKKPRLALESAALERQARKVMSPEGFAYIAGGAGDESTMHNNRSAFDKWRILPRMLRDVSQRDLSIDLLGLKLPAPLLLAPLGVLEMAHPQADLAVARAAAAAGVPMIFSNQASVPMETCARVMGDTPRWFQLYWSKSDELVKSLVLRAEQCGCSAIVLTLDTTLLGWRPRDLGLAYLPFLRGKGIAQYTSDPVFMENLRKMSPQATRSSARINLSSLKALVEMAQAFPGSFWHNLSSPLPRLAVQQFIETYSRPSLTWENLAALKDLTRLPVLLKGILHPKDARKAVEHGIQGLIVSNHGGRQVDGAMAALDALPGIVEAVAGRIPVLFDSGIRSGADIYKALALGAKAVCIGRPYAYGLAIAGQAGVEEVLLNLMSELELTMGLAGCKNINDISPLTPA